MSKVIEGVVFSTFIPTGDPIYPGKNGEKVLYPGGDPRLSGRTVCSLADRRLAGLAHPEILFPGKNGEEVFDLTSQFFPGLPRLSFLPSTERTQRSLTPGILRTLSLGLPAGVLGASTSVEPAPRKPEIAWEAFSGTGEERDGPVGSYVAEFQLEKKMGLEDFPITFYNGYAAVDGSNHVYVATLNTRREKIVVRGFRPTDNYETDEWSALAILSDGDAPVYGPPYLSAFTSYQGDDELAIGVALQPSSSDPQSVSVYRQKNPHRLFLAAPMGVLWEQVLLSGIGSQPDRVSLIHDEGGNLHLVCQALDTTGKFPSTTQIYYAFLPKTGDFQTVGSSGWQVMRVTELSTQNYSLNGQTYQWENDELPTVAAYNGQVVIAWRRNSTLLRKKKKGPSRIDTMIRVLDVRTSPFSITSERRLENVKDPTAWVHPHPLQHAHSTPTFFVGSDPADSIAAGIAFTSAHASNIEKLADELVANQRILAVEGNSNADFFSGTAGWGYFIARWECINTNPHQITQIWGLSGVMTAGGESQERYWSVFTDMANQLGRPGAVVEGTAFLYPVTSLPGNSYMQLLFPILSVDVGSSVVCEGASLPEADGRYTVNQIYYIGGGSTPTWEMSKTTSINTTPLTSSLWVDFKAYDKLTFAGYPAIRLGPPSLRFNTAESNPIVHLFWFESHTASPRNGVSLGLANGETLYLRYRRGILSSTPTLP